MSKRIFNYNHCIINNDYKDLQNKLILHHMIITRPNNHYEQKTKRNFGFYLFNTIIFMLIYNYQYDFFYKLVKKLMTNLGFKIKD